MYSRKYVSDISSHSDKPISFHQKNLMKVHVHWLAYNQGIQYFLSFLYPRTQEFQT